MGRYRDEVQAGEENEGGHMKRWIKLTWFLVFPYMITYSSTTPSYATLKLDKEVVIDCRGFNPEWTKTCNLIAERMEDIAQDAYEIGTKEKK